MIAAVKTTVHDENRDGNGTVSKRITADSIPTAEAETIENRFIVSSSRSLAGVLIVTDLVFFSSM